MKRKFGAFVDSSPGVFERFFSDVPRNRNRMSHVFSAFFRGKRQGGKGRMPVKVEINDYITWICLFGEFLRIVAWWTTIQKVTICENMLLIPI